jgi:hypothetical protein
MWKILADIEDVMFGIEWLAFLFPRALLGHLLLEPQLLPLNWSSLKRRQDDAAPPIFEVVHKTASQVIQKLNYLQFKQNDQRQTGKVESKAKSAEYAYASVMDVEFFLVDQWEKNIGSPTYIENNKVNLFKKESDQRRHKNQGYYYFARSRSPEFTDATRMIQP